MANVQTENGFTKIANEILESIAKLPLNGTQFKILLVVWRSTYGFQKKSHDLSLNYLVKACCCSKTSIKAEIKTLIAANILKEESIPTFNSTREISFNKDYELYRVTKLTQGNRSDITQGNYSDIPQGRDSATKKESIKKDIKKVDFSDETLALWKEYPRKEGRQEFVVKMPKLIKKHGLEQMQRTIERYSSKVSNVKKELILMGGTFINGRFEDYLDANYIPQKEISYETKIAGSHAIKI